MGLVQDIRKAAAGHGHGCPCGDCLKEYNGRGRYGFDAVLGWRLLGAAVLLAAGVAVRRALPALSVVLFAASILAAGWDVLLRAIGGAIRRRAVDDSLLMSVAAVAALAIGRGAEGAFYMLLLGLGVLVRGFLMERARRDLQGSVDEPKDPSGPLAALLQGEGEPTRMEEFITHFARFYTPIILVIAVLIALLSPILLHQTLRESVYRALILLVIACPCALVASVPLAYLAGRGGAARRGVLFRSSAAMGRVCRVGGVVFDADAALKERGLRVVSVKSDRMDADTLLRIAAHACALAEGDYADSIRAAYRGTIYIELIQHFRQEEHRVSVRVEGVDILLGSAEDLRARGADPGADRTEEPSLYIAIDGQYAGRIVFGGVVREETAQVAKVLEWDRSAVVVMVSEESTSAVEKLARSAGIGQYYAGCGAEAKAAVLRDMKERQLEGGSLLYVGEPAAAPDCFREADVGVYAGPETAETILSAAGLVLTDGALTGLLTAISAARRARSVAWQNIAGTLAVKVIILLMDMLGVCPLWLAMLADVGVSLAAALNCLRAVYDKEPELS